MKWRKPWTNSTNPDSASLYATVYWGGFGLPIPPKPPPNSVPATRYRIDDEIINLTFSNLSISIKTLLLTDMHRFKRGIKFQHINPNATG